MNLINTLASCNDLGVTIPPAIFNLTHIIVLIIQIVVPILLIIWGMLDFAKGLVQGSEENIKKGQKTFIQRLITAIVVFLVVTVTTLAINFVTKVTDDDGASTAADCISSFINGAQEGN